MSKDIVLSNRLQAVTAMVTKGNRVCDVGCDHGFVSIYLVKNDISNKVIAMDVNKGPLMAAREHIDDYGLSDYIETRLSDGVAALHAQEADTLICAGMGGRLIRQILEDGRDKIHSLKELILQPQSEIQSVREYLREMEYSILDENMILEDGKYYPLLKISLFNEKPDKDSKSQPAGMSQMDWRRLEDKYGPVLLKKKNKVLYGFLQRERNIYENILTHLDSGDEKQYLRHKEILTQMGDTDQALFYMKSEEICI